MKSILLAITILASSSSAFAMQPGIMLQPYLLCTSHSTALTDYNLIIENAAIGNATGIKLIRYQQNEWHTIAQDTVLQIKDLPAPMGFKSKEYTGATFKVTHIEGYSSDVGQAYKNQARINLALGDRVFNGLFQCSSVQ